MFSEIEKQNKTGISRSPESIEKQKNTIREQYRNGRKGTTFGKRLSEDHRCKISEKNSKKEVPLESRSSLDGFILRYGEKDGLERYLETNSKKSSNSLTAVINRYGEIEGTKIYNERREKISEKMSGSNNPFYGKTHSDETKELLRSQKLGKSIHRSEEHNQKIGNAHRGKKQKQVQCPHCGKTGGASVMQQWHFQKCKMNSLT